MRKKMTARILGILLVFCLVMGNFQGIQAYAEEGSSIQNLSEKSTENASASVQDENGDNREESADGKEENSDGKNESVDSKNENVDSGDDMEDAVGKQDDADSEGTQKDDSGSSADAGKTPADTEKKDEGSTSSGNTALKSRAAVLSNESEEEQKETKKTGVGMTVTFRVEGYGMTVQYPVSVTMPDTYKTLEEYGLTGTYLQDPGYYTPLHVMAQYCLDKGKKPAQEIDAGGGWLEDFLGAGGNYGQVSGTYWMFYVNDQYPADDEGYGYLITDCPLKSEDTLTLYNIYYGDQSTEYSRFDQTSMSMTEEEEKSIRLVGDSGNISGAKLLLLDENGKEIADPVVFPGGETGSDGQAKFTVNQAGTYILTAEKVSSSGIHLITRPYCKLTVAALPELTDKEAVAQTKEALTLGDVSAVTGDIKLPVTGKKGTTITWRSSDETVIKSDGTVVRSRQEEKTVILTATISRGNVSDNKEFEVTVKQLTDEEILTDLREAVESVKIASAGLTMEEGEDTNIFTAWQTRMGQTDIEVKIMKQPDDFTAIGEDGSITYGEEMQRGDITFQFYRTGIQDVTYEKTVKIRVPAHEPTLQEKIDAVAASINFDLIKKDNTDEESITGNLNLPTSLYSINYDWMMWWDIELRWSCDNTEVLEPSYGTGEVTRPAYGESDEMVKLTATVQPNAYATEKAEAREITFNLTVKAYTEGEYQAGENAVNDVLDAITEEKLGTLTEIGGGKLDLSAVTYDIQLKSPKDLLADTDLATTAGGMSYQWGSTGKETDKNRIEVSSYRGKVYRTLGAGDTSTELTLTLTMNGYTKTKNYPVTIQGLTEEEIQAEKSDMETCISALADGIKGENESTDYINRELKTVYRMDMTEDEVHYYYTNAGVKGDGFQLDSWTSSNSKVIGSYLKLNRGNCEKDTKVTVSNTIHSIRYENACLEDGTAAVPEKKVEIPLTVAAYTTDFDLLAASIGELGYKPGIETYTLRKEETEKTMSLSVKTRDPEAEVTVAGTKVENPYKGEVVIVGIGQDTQDILIETVCGTKSSRIVVTVTSAVSGEPLPELSGAWTQHYGNTGNNSVVDAKTPTEGAELAWSAAGAVISNPWGDSGYAGHPVLVNGDLYAARGQQLDVIDKATGKVKKSVKLQQPVGYYSYITYGDGKIFVPLTNGQIQCFSASTLDSLFITAIPVKDADGETLSLQALSSVYYQDGMIYTGFTSTSGASGFFAAYRTADTDKDQPLEIVRPVWTVDTQMGYYGSGAVSVGDGAYIAFAGDAGILTVTDAKTGLEKGRVQLDGGVRSAVVEAEGFLWVTTKAGKLYKLSVSGEGAVSVKAEASLPDTTVSTPVVADGKVIITGGSFVAGGYLQVYDMDLKLFAETHTDAEVKTPTVTTAYEDLYLYFVQNMTPGGLYVAKVTSDGKIEVTLLHEPEQKNYSMSNVVADEDGMLYYSNDSGYMFALKPGKEPIVQNPEEPEEKPEEGTTSNGGDTIPEEQKPSDRKPSGNRRSPQTLQQGKFRNLSFNSGAKRSTQTTGETKTTTEIIIEAISMQAESGGTSVTVKNPPEKIEAAVFAELAKHPDMKLILDCGTYTVSIAGRDVTDTKASLSLKFVKLDETLPEGTAEKFGLYEIYELVQSGNLPGTVTVVYPLSSVLEQAGHLYLYSMDRLSEAADVVCSDGYMMFTLEEAGKYVISSADVNEEEIPVETVSTESTDSSVSGEITEEQPRMPAMLAGVGLGIVLGLGIAGAGMIVSRKRRNRTWE